VLNSDAATLRIANRLALINADAFRTTRRDGVLQPFIGNQPLPDYFTAVKGTRYDVAVKTKTQSPEYNKFASALRKVLAVSHSDIKAMLDAEKRTKRRHRTRRSASRASNGKG